MSYAYALKVLCDVAYYFAIVSLFGPSAGQTGMLPAAPVTIGICAFLSHVLAQRERRWLRYLPLLGLPVMFLFTRSRADFVLCVPPALYLCWYVHKRPHVAAYGDVVSQFYLCLKILPFPAVFGALFGNWGAIGSIVVPYLFIFLVLSVILMRTLRHDEETMAQTRFKLMNLAGIVTVGVVGWLLSSGLMLKLFRLIGAGLVHFVLRPLLTLVIYAFAGIVWLISHLVTGIKFDPSEIDLSQLGENLELGDMQGVFSDADGEAAIMNPIWDYVLIGLVLIAVAAIIFVIFRTLSRHGRHEDDNVFDDVRETVDPGEARGWGNPYENRQRVRHYYRKFLRLSEQRGFDRTEFQDSAEIMKGTRFLFPGSSLYRLREIYVRARYSSAEVTARDVQDARECYQRMKKNDPS